MTDMLQVARLAEVQVAIQPEAIEQRDDLLQIAAQVREITDDASQSAAVSVMRSLKGMIKAVEDSRKAVKAPVLDIGRTIDGIAAEFVGLVEKESTRLNGLLSDYQAKARKAAEEAERLRQAELKRQTEERERLEAEQRKLEADARAAAEAARLAAEAEFLADEPNEATSLAAAAAAEALRVEREKLAAVEAARRAAEADRLRVLATPARQADKPKGVSVSDVWRFEVLDLDALMKARRDLVRVEPNKEAINDAMRRGAREIPGLRIYSETVANVRAV